MRSYTPLRYPGGKSQMYNQVKEIYEINKLSNHAYAEPFTGGGGVALRLLVEGVVSKIYLNDLDVAIYSFWYSIINYTDEFIKLVDQAQLTIDEWTRQKNIQKSKSEINLNDKDSILSLGFSTFYLNRTNRSGIINAGVIGGQNQQGNYKMDCRFNKEKLIKLISTIGALGHKIELYNLDAIEFLKILSRKRNIFYFIDPPYYKMGAQLYHNALTHTDHVNIEKYIKKNMRKKKWIITYDVCEEIDSIYSKHENKVLNPLRYSLSKKVKKEEFLFFNSIENIWIKEEKL